MSVHPRARQLGVVLCHACALVCEDTLGRSAHAQCPRCGATLHRRRPASIARAWAFLAAAMIFYIPANVLPVMHSRLFGSGSDNTIAGGIVEFWQEGSYGIALVIFVASVVVPWAKFLALGLLLSTSRRRSAWARRERARLYRLVELVGYFSMLDVLVVALVCALIRFQPLASMEPRMGICFFGLAVVLTMLSTLSFDPQLIWDGDGNA